MSASPARGMGYGDALMPGFPDAPTFQVDARRENGGRSCIYVQAPTAGKALEVALIRFASTCTDYVALEARES